MSRNCKTFKDFEKKFYLKIISKDPFIIRQNGKYSGNEFFGLSAFKIHYVLGIFFKSIKTQL
jgi:hypothetical protein